MWKEDKPGSHSWGSAERFVALERRVIANEKLGYTTLMQVV